MSSRRTFLTAALCAVAGTAGSAAAAPAAVSRVYLRKCYVEGDVDFIFGRGLARP